MSRRISGLNHIYNRTHPSRNLTNHQSRNRSTTLTMRLTFPLYSISLLALTAVAPYPTQGFSDTSAQQQQVLDDAATALATLHDQVPKDIITLQGLASNGVFGGNATLASENSLLIAILGRIPQLAQDLSAALNETNIPAPAPPATPTPTATPTAISTPTSTPITPKLPGPALLQKRCNILQTQFKLFTAIKQPHNTFARATDGGAGFVYPARKFSQTESECQGDPSATCISFNSLAAQFQAVGDQVLAEAKQYVTPNSGINKNSDVSLFNLGKVIIAGASTVLASITSLSTSLKCS